MPAPVMEPKNRQPETLSFDDSNIIFKDFQNGFIEYQFEELRLRDMRANQYGRELLRSDYENPLSKENLASRVINSPTINMQYAMNELGGLMQGTPTLNFGGNLQPNLADATVNFSGLSLSVMDMEQRNADRGLALKMDDVI